MKRVRYNRGDLDSTMKAALKVSTTEPRFVFATCYGYTISDAPPTMQNYYRTHKGHAERVEYAPRSEEFLNRPLKRVR